MKYVHTDTHTYRLDTAEKSLEEHLETGTGDSSWGDKQGSLAVRM